MADHLNPDEEVLLQSALSTAFTPAPLPRQSVHLDPSPPPPASQFSPSPPAQDAGFDYIAEPQSTEAVWKAEYEAHVEEWRQRSADQRQKAEEERARWEARRAREREEGTLSESFSALSAAGSGWESVGPAGHGASPSPADARDLVAGEAQGARPTEACVPTPLPRTRTPLTTTPAQAAAHARGASEPESARHDKWEEIPSSLASSYPSLSFPSDPHSPTSSARPAARSAPLHARDRAPLPPSGAPDAVPPGGATLSVFDRSLSPRRRVLALVSSLAINVLLPFVNGVMLGFGEIFAKNVVVGWLGWKPAGPGALAASVGLGSSKRR